MTPALLEDVASSAFEGEEMAQQFVQNIHGKGVIDRAGRTVAGWWFTPGAPMTDEVRDALLVVENWRTSHSMPLLTFRMGLTGRARKVSGGDFLIAQRLKRFTSIMAKLDRQGKMALSQMQDLGGCRAILPSVSGVDELYGYYRPSASLLDEEGDGIKCYDYIRNPKPDGYRGIHVVGRYRASVPKNEPWNGHRIEIQIRTKLQHAFATAVETVTTFTREPLKFGSGSDAWRLFFTLMGSVLAIREGTPLVKGTPTNRTELVGELRHLTRSLKVYERLRGWAHALKTLPRRNMTDFNWLLLVLNVSEGTIKVTGFKDRPRADKALANLERSKNKDLDAVLVWVNSAQDLRVAYPNYYADTREFLNALGQSLRP